MAPMRVIQGTAARPRLELPRFRGHQSALGEMIAREVSDAKNETAISAGLPR